MNLEQIVNSVITPINPNTFAVYRASSGYSTDQGGKRIPLYAPDQPLYIQVQALSGGDIRKIEGLNLQGIKAAVYIIGRAHGLVRPASKGGDLLFFDPTNVFTIGESSIGGPDGIGAPRCWLVAEVLENWSNWTKLVVVLQNDMGNFPAIFSPGISTIGGGSPIG